MNTSLGSYDVPKSTIGGFWPPLFGLITSSDILLRSITSTLFIMSLGRIQTSFIVMVGGASSLIVSLIFLPPNLNVGSSHDLIHSVVSKFSELFVEFTF